MNPHAPSTALTTIFAGLALHAIGPAFATAQESEPTHGFLELVNLISLEEPTTLELGGYDVAGGKPLPPGGSSGIATLLADTYDFTVRNDGAKPSTLTGQVEVPPNGNAKIIFFEQTEKSGDGKGKDEEDEKPKAKLLYTILSKKYDGDGPRMTIVSLLDEPADQTVSIGGRNVHIRSRQPYQHEVEEGTEVPVRYQDRLLDTIEIARPIHYLLFLYRDPETKMPALSLVLNEQLEYQPPLEPEEENEEGTEASSTSEVQE